MLRKNQVVNHLQVKEELLNRIRSADIISTTLRGVTTQTDLFDGDNTETEFYLTKSGVKNIRSVTVGASILVAFVDYTFTLSENTGGDFIISFTTPPISGTNNISIVYDYSTVGDRIYDDFDMHTIKNEDKFPRIAFDIVSENTTLESINRELYKNNILFIFKSFGRGKNETETISNNLRDFLFSIRDDLQRLRYIEPTGRSAIALWLEGKTQKIFRKDLTFTAPTEFET